MCAFGNHAHFLELHSFIEIISSLPLQTLLSSFHIRDLYDLLFLFVEATSAFEPHMFWICICLLKVLSSTWERSIILSESAFAFWRFSPVHENVQLFCNFHKLIPGSHLSFSLKCKYEQHHDGQQINGQVWFPSLSLYLSLCSLMILIEIVS